MDPTPSHSAVRLTRGGKIKGKGGKVGAKALGASNILSPTARLGGQRAYCPTWHLSTYCVHLRQPRQAALMDYSHYLPHHCLNIYQTIMYLVARHGEWKGQETELLGQMQGLITDWINPLLI